jgi:hypothetical protein
MNTESTKLARKGNNVNATKVGKLVEKGYHQKLVKLTPLCDWLEGKVYTFGCKSLPTAREIYAQLNLLPEPGNLPRSRSGKKVRRHQNARPLISVLRELHRCYELGELLPYSWQEIANYLKKCSYDLDALPGLFNDENATYTEAEGLDPVTITDSKETHTLQVMKMIDRDNWQDFLGFFGEDLNDIKELTIDALERCNMYYNLLKMEDPQLASKLALGHHKKFRQFIAEICAKLTINE